MSCRHCWTAFIFRHGNYGFIKATAGKIRREASPFADGDRDFMRNIPAENKKAMMGKLGKRFGSLLMRSGKSIKYLFLLIIMKRMAKKTS